MKIIDDHLRLIFMTIFNIFAIPFLLSFKKYT